MPAPDQLPLPTTGAPVRDHHLARHRRALMHRSSPSPPGPPRRQGATATRSASPPGGSSIPAQHRRTGGQTHRRRARSRLRSREGGRRSPPTPPHPSLPPPSAASPARPGNRVKPYIEELIEVAPRRRAFGSARVVTDTSGADAKPAPPLRRPVPTTDEHTGTGRSAMRRARGNIAWKATTRATAMRYRRSHVRGGPIAYEAPATRAATFRRACSLSVDLHLLRTSRRRLAEPCLRQVAMTVDVSTSTRATGLTSSHGGPSGSGVVSRGPARG